MSEDTITPLPNPSGFSPDLLTGVIRDGARKLIEPAIEVELGAMTEEMEPLLMVAVPTLDRLRRGAGSRGSCLLVSNARGIPLYWSGAENDMEERPCCKFRVSEREGF